MIMLSHGSEGIKTLQLIMDMTRDVTLRKVKGVTSLDELDDSASIPLEGSS